MMDESGIAKKKSQPLILYRSGSFKSLLMRAVVMARLKLKWVRLTSSSTCCNLGLNPKPRCWRTKEKRKRVNETLSIAPTKGEIEQDAGE